MTSVGVFEAKTHLSDLIDRAERGEEITITRRGKAVAKLVPAGIPHDREKARRAVAELREIAKGMPKISLEEWLQFRDEGRR
ncbi:type II toxin-antitoxin system prevent-host-death family antitoxin [soil metagenome]